MEIVNLAPESVEFHAIVETEVNRLEYGTIAINVQLIDGKPILETLSLVTSKRKKYVFDKESNSV